ncbi:MAG: chemotaxis protein CheW [Albidovulum sp.]|uniref:chemotaxis protein CheW n=1 Tax=Albidovulum sp. TaxID=1872424 RepID=UPI003CBB6EF7
MQEPVDHRPQSGALSSADGEVELLACHLGQEVFCIDVTAIRELRCWSPPTPLPHAPASLTGVINLRGTILPVVDLAARLGLPPLIADSRNVIVVVSLAGQATGLVVSAVSDIHRVAQASLTPPPPISGESADACIAALALIEDHMIRIIDLAALLPRQTMDAA